MAEKSGWLTLEEAAMRAGVNIRKFRTMVRQGEIPTSFDFTTRRRVVHASRSMLGSKAAESNRETSGA